MIVADGTPITRSALVLLLRRRLGETPAMNARDEKAFLVVVMRSSVYHDNDRGSVAAKASQELQEARYPSTPRNRWSYRAESFRK